MSENALEFVKLICIPAIISLSLFLSINYLIRPAIQRYRDRYEQYLPLHSISNSLTQHTKSIKDRIGDRIMAFILPRFQIDRDGGGTIDDGEELFGTQDGQDMVGFDDFTSQDVQRRREQLRRDVGNMESARRSAEDFGEPL